MKEFIDKTSTQEGTPINREALMSAQGFQGNTIVFNNDGSITETNSDGHVLTTTFEDDGSVNQIFVGTKTAQKTTRFVGESIMEEVIV